MPPGSLPPPAAPSAGRPRSSAPDLSWDDEFENTAVFADERAGRQERKKRRAGAVRSSLPPAASGRDLRKVLGVVVGVIVLAAIATAFLLPKQGQLIVTVSGPGNTAVDELTVLVDEEVKCSSSPCQVAGLGAGVHIVRVEAPGYPALAGRAVEVKSGEDALHEVALGGAAVEGTGLKIPALGKYLRLELDGEDRGSLPVDLKALKPGSHRIRIHGNERYAVYEDNVDVEAGRVLNLQPKLKVLKGLAKLTAGAGARGARVMLECAGEDRLLVQLPTSVDIAVDKPCKLSAKRQGYQDFQALLAFDEGKAEKTFTVELSQVGSGGEAAASDRADKPTAGADRTPARAAGGGKGTIRVNSIPPSTAVLSGRPLGPTPTSATVDPGTYSVMFIHPEHGRKTVTVRVKAGGSAVASVKFP